MRVSVIADVHCRGSEDSAQRSFVEWVSALDVDELWILGDLFHFGWAFDGCVQPVFQDVMDALGDLDRRGCRIVFVPGNHDFGVADLFKDVLNADVRGQHIRSIDGLRVSLSHGDEFDASWRYRWFRWGVRSRLFASLINALGPKRGSSVLKRMAGDVSVGGALWERSRESIMEMLEDSDLVLMGHVHTPWSYTGNDGTALVLTPGVPILIEDGVLVTERPG